ncbi:hypothetical protein GmHk_06G016529 [Glycine max]|nr:hypothetical protein GmHk_06G016529 [Glycine max]
MHLVEGLSSLQKCIAAIRILAYELPVNSVDEYLKIGGSTVVKCLEAFVKGVNKIFGDEYLRRLNNNNINCLLQIREARGFPDASSNNDINELNQSPVFNGVMQDRASLVQFTINETTRNMGYYLVDDIYSDWATLVKTIPMPQKKKSYLQNVKEAVRKDVERAFGVLKSHFAIIYGSSRN